MFENTKVKNLLVFYTVLILGIISFLLNPFMLMLYFNNSSPNNYAIILFLISLVLSIFVLIFSLKKRSIETKYLYGLIIGGLSISTHIIYFLYFLYIVIVVQPI